MEFITYFNVNFIFNSKLQSVLQFFFIIKNYYSVFHFNFNCDCCFNDMFLLFREKIHFDYCCESDSIKKYFDFNRFRIKKIVLK